LGEGDPLTVSGAFQLRDHHCLFELRHGSENLPDQNGSRSVVQERIRLIGRNQLDPLFLEEGIACLLHNEVTSETVGRLYDDGPNTIPGDPLHHGREARAGRHLVCTAHGLIIERIH
jgi:hypothetical protein